MKLFKKIGFVSCVGLFLCSFTDTNIDELSTGEYKTSLGTCSLIEEQKVKDKAWSYSNWFFHEENADLLLVHYKLYKYSRYVDLPVEILFERSIRSGEQEDFEIEISKSTTTTYKVIQSETNTTFSSLKHSLSLSSNWGSSLNIFDLFEFSNEYGVSGTTTFELGKSFSQTYTNSFEKKFNFKLSYKENVHVENPYNFQINYRLCFRQKFSAYLFQYYEYEYEQIAHHNGVHGTTYTYESKLTDDSGTYLILIPTGDNCYLDESFYANNVYGELFNIETRVENNVLYL